MSPSRRQGPGPLKLGGVVLVRQGRDYFITFRCDDANQMGKAPPGDGSLVYDYFGLIGNTAERPTCRGSFKADVGR